MLRYLDQGAFLVGGLLALLVGFLGHNLSQTWAARALGDHLPLRAGFGRLTWAQLDVLGVIAAVLTVNGWGFTAPVPMDTRLRRRPRSAVALMVGPVFLLAQSVLVAAARGNGVTSFADRALLFAEIVSAGLFVTSMIPIPPLAFGRVLWMYAPTTGGWANARNRLEQESIGRLIAFGVLMLPVIIRSLPDPVGELALPLARRLTEALGGG